MKQEERQNVRLNNEKMMMEHREEMLRKMNQKQQALQKVQAQKHE